MKKTCAILFAFIIALLFAACGAEEVNTDVTAHVFAPDTSFVLAKEECEEVCETAAIEFSPLAKVQYLEPLEDFSWEREFAPEYVMIHFTSAVVLSKSDPYNMKSVRKIFEDSGVSIHYIIDRDGEIYCYIPETRAAWHAGKGTFAADGRLTNAMNKYSIGIELVAIGSARDMAQYLSANEYAALDKSLIGYTDAQYESLSLLVKDVCKRNQIAFDREHIIGHSEYKEQKSDPGELFDWARIFN